MTSVRTYPLRSKGPVPSEPEGEREGALSVSPVSANPGTASPPSEKMAVSRPVTPERQFSDVVAGRSTTPLSSSGSSTPVQGEVPEYRPNVLASGEAKPDPITGSGAVLDSIMPETAGGPWTEVTYRRPRRACSWDCNTSMCS